MGWAQTPSGAPTVLSAGQEAQGRLKEHDTVGMTLRRGRSTDASTSHKAQSQPSKAGRRPVEKGAVGGGGRDSPEAPSAPRPLYFPDTRVSCVPTVVLLTVNLKTTVKHSSITQITTVINPFVFL